MRNALNEIENLKIQKTLDVKNNMTEILSVMGLSVVVKRESYVIQIESS